MKGYIPILLAIIIGFVFGNLIFDSYETEVVMNSDGNVYMLQYGAYTNEEVMKENIKKLDSESYIVDVIDNIYSNSQASRYIASFVPFAYDNINNSYIKLWFIW